MKQKEKIDLLAKTDAIFAKTVPILKQIYKEYSVFNVSIDVFSDMIKNKREQLKYLLSQEEKNLDDHYIKSCLKTLLDEQISQQLNEESIYDILNNLINQNTIDTDNSNDCFVLLGEISNILIRFSYQPSTQLFERLIRENKKLTALLDEMNLTDKKNCLNEQSLGVLQKNSTIHNLAEVYCKIKRVDKSNEKKLSKGLLTSEQTAQLIINAQAGDVSSRDILIENNLDLVKSQAKKFWGRGLEFEDLYQEGCIGLMECIYKFDVSLGNEFSTYAVTAIKNQINAALQQNYKQRTGKPSYMYQATYKYKQAKENLQKTLGQPPNTEQLAEEMNLPTGTVKKLQALPADPVSLNELMRGRENSELEKVISTDEDQPEDIVFSKELENKLNELFESCNLTNLERETLINYFGLFNTPSISQIEISKNAHVSRECISERKINGLKKLRKMPQIDDFAIYMDNPEGCLEYIKTQRKNRPKN